MGDLLKEELEKWLKDHGDCLGNSALVNVLVFVDKKIREAETKKHAEPKIEEDRKGIEQNICQHCHQPIRKAHPKGYYIHDNGLKNVCDLPYHGRFYFAEPLKIEYVEVVKLCEGYKHNITEPIDQHDPIKFNGHQKKLWNLIIDEIIDKIKSLQGSTEPQNEKCGNKLFNNPNVFCIKPKGHLGNHENEDFIWDNSSGDNMWEKNHILKKRKDAGAE